MITTNRIYYGVGLVGLIYLTVIFWTEPLQVIVRGGPVLPLVEVGRWVLVVGILVAGWATLGSHPPGWARWIAAPLAGGVWLQVIRYFLGVDAPVLVGLRWCWIVRESTLVERGNQLNFVYTTELNRLFGGTPPQGVPLLPQGGSLLGPETLLWGDLTSLGTTQALYEHTVWLAKASLLNSKPVVTPPGWSDWLFQWGPTVGVVVMGIALAGVYFYHGDLLQGAANTTQELASAVTKVTTHSEGLAKVILYDQTNVVRALDLVNNQHGILFIKVNQVVKLLLALADLPVTTPVRSLPPEVFVDKVTNKIALDTLAYLQEFDPSDEPS